jgi:hypothetical protein
MLGASLAGPTIPFFEVHDNVSAKDIRELESLLLHIFRYDPRIEIANRQLGSSILAKLDAPPVRQATRPNKAVGADRRAIRSSRPDVRARRPLNRER